MSATPLRPTVECQDDSDAFLHSLRESRLLSEEQLDDVRLQLRDQPVRVVSSFLISKAWLNGYQLMRVLDGQAGGLVLGPYRILSELGEGGFGTVYKAVHPILDRPAAVKVISPKWGQSPVGRDFFLREVLAVARLAHPNIATVYDAGQTDDALWFAMEYVDGMNLEDYVLSRGPLPVAFACAIARQVAGALQCAHENGVVHRDVKPANILLAGVHAREPSDALVLPDATVKVVDFGLARIGSSGESSAFSLTKDGLCVGTASYMPLEQMRDSHRVDSRSDLYSLGCVFYFALAGRPPFEGDTPLEVVLKKERGQTEPLSHLRPDLPSGVAAVVQRLMAANQKDRYATAADFIEGLCLALAPPPTPLPAPAPPASQEARATGDRTPDEEGPPEEGEARPPAPPPPPAPRPAVKPLAPGSWREWLAVVGALSRGEAAAWTEGEYKLLYQSLLTDLCAAAGPCGELEEFVGPWLTLRALTGLDRKSLADLWRAGRRLEAERFAARRPSFLAWTGILAFLVALAGLLATILGGR